MPSTSVVAARLPDGRLLIASLDPTVPEHHSPLRHHLRAAPHLQVSDLREKQGEEQPGQTRIRTPR